MGLGEKVAGTLLGWTHAAFDFISKTFGKPLGDFIDGFFSRIAQTLMGGLLKSFGPLSRYGFPLESITDQIYSLQELHGLAQLLVAPFFFLGSFALWFEVVLRAHGEKARRLVYQSVTPKGVGPDVLLEAMLKGKLPPATARIFATYLGLPYDQFDILDAARRTPPGPEQVRDASLRGIITDGQATEWLLGLGFQPEAIPVLKKLFFFIPPANDLILMAVREAFTPDIAQKFGQYEDFPPDFAKYAAQQGISSEWAQRYWAAHWNLPSVLQGYEMLHRGVIPEADLKMLMRALDIMPWWRDKLIQISYAPFTRVDVRRMYNTGVLSVPEVKRAYMDIGYTAEKAEKLTQFTIALNTETDRDLTKSDLIDGFSRGLIPETEALDLLQSMGYSDREARFYLERAKLKKIEAKKKQAITNAQKRFKAGVISADEATRRLLEAGVTQGEIDELFSLWDISKDEAVYEPTVGDLKALLKNGIIEEAEFISEMTKKGAEPKYINWLIRLIASGAE